MAIWCVHPLPGTEINQRQRLSNPGMAGTDCCSGCFCCFMRLSFPKKREEESEIKLSFAILLDEWDCLFREYQQDQNAQKTRVFLPCNVSGRVPHSFRWN